MPSLVVYDLTPHFAEPSDTIAAEWVFDVIVEGVPGSESQISISPLHDY